MIRRFALLVLAFFALYALMAQRGTAWGDSLEFQDWILRHSEFVCGASFSNAHPLYVAFARLVAPTPFAVNLVSALFGALAVGGLFLATRRMTLAVLFGLSQMLAWLSAIAEVQTMNLAFTAFGAAFFLRFLETDRTRDLAVALAVTGVQLLVHNFAVLVFPVYAAAALVRRRPTALACGLLAAAPWLFFLVTRGPADVLFGAYGAKVAGVWPTNLTETAFNFGLAALSFVVPAALAWWNRATLRPSLWVLALLALNAVFFVRYFVPDQSQFLLPTLFFAYVALKDVEIRKNRLVALAAVQILLPVFAYLVLDQMPMPEERRTRHPGRNDAAYFTLPGRVAETEGRW